MTVKNIKKWATQPLNYETTTRTIELNLDLFDEGASQTEEFIIFKESTTYKVYDRVCDHSNGRLGIQHGLARCPLHGWQINLQSGQYTNVTHSKTPIAIIDEHEIDSPLIQLTTYDERLLPNNFSNSYTTRVEFLNHACLMFEIDNVLRFATDPWVIGPAFNNGWWLATTSRFDVFDKLNECDFIYVSHNHPDHLHPLSLNSIRKDMPIITADFESGSTVRLLTQLGFQTIIPMDFNTQLIEQDYNLSLSVLKSGDFRDDSGLFVELGDFSALLTVDSNFLNFGRFPQSVDLLCSSFAGGASGFPLCFENYSDAEKRTILIRNQNAIRATDKKSIEASGTRYFMPYAGFFSEDAERDRYIYDKNIKNTISDFTDMCSTAKCSLLDVSKSQIFEFEGHKCTYESKAEVEKIKDKSITEYLYETLSTIPFLSDSSIKQYFLNSGFHDELLVKFELTSDDFDLTNRSFHVEFDPTNDPLFMQSAEKDDFYVATLTNKRFLRLKIRELEFYDVLANGKPWEDLSIGFQMRIFRNPNIYNSEFWQHFTNVYIADKVFFGPEPNGVTSKTQ